MKTTLYVSRYDLVVCPYCKVHIRVAENWEETSCPFCNVLVNQTQPFPVPTSQSPRWMSHTKLLSAALVGLTFSACVSISSLEPHDSPQEKRVEAFEPPQKQEQERASEPVQEPFQEPVREFVRTERVSTFIDSYGGPPDGRGWNPPTPDEDGGSSHE